MVGQARNVYRNLPANLFEKTSRLMDNILLDAGNICEGGNRIMFKGDLLALAVLNHRVVVCVLCRIVLEHAWVCLTSCILVAVPPSLP